MIPAEPPRERWLNRNVWALAVTSLLSDLGHETATAALPSFLAAIGAPGPRWDGADPASLERVLFHLLQEYARHLGHLDIVVELADPSVGQWTLGYEFSVDGERFRWVVEGAPSDNARSVVGRGDCRRVVDHHLGVDALGQCRAR